MNAETTPQWPADRVERWAIDRLVPYESNARTHSESQVLQIVEAIKEWGWTTPILVQPDGGIIAGHGRVLAAKKLGLHEVPVMVARGWTPAQVSAYVLADNRITENAGWDRSILASELAALVDSFDLSKLGFDERELSRYLDIAAGVGAGLTDENAVPAVQEALISAPGDLWELGEHRLICGDCTQPDVVARLLGTVKPSLMVTDPPYGVDYDPEWRARAGVNRNTEKLGTVTNDERADWRTAWELFPGTVAYVWHAGIHARTVQESLEAVGFDIRAQIVWAKSRFALSRGHYHWQHEPCWYAVRGAASNWSGDRSQSTLWTIEEREDSGHGHGTQKPVECMRRPLLNNSSAGQAVYEPFAGSGTTLIAAQQTGRACYAIEIEPRYVDVAIRRWQGFTGRQAVLAGTGAPFGEGAPSGR